MGFTLETGISVTTVFFQGVFSFFSPCVLPLVPIYLAYLSGEAGDFQNRTETSGNRLRLFLRVFCFTLGIGGAFFTLGLSASVAGALLNEYKWILSGAGGIIVILFGLYQLGIFGRAGLLGQEHRIPFHVEKMTMSPVTAFLMGFTFSFAWTPCVGPTLASVLLMTGSAQTGAKGFLFIGVYTLGFILPFLAAGIYTAKLLSLFRKNMKIVRYAVKAGGILMVFLGAVMITGAVRGINESDSSGIRISAQKEELPEGDSGTEEADNDTTEKKPARAAVDFSLTDQFGNLHEMKEYKGKVVFLNFWATWCGPCRNEMPDIQKLYEEYQVQGDEAEVIILGVAGPKIGQEGTVEEITEFMEQNGYSYPVLMDETGQLFEQYGISAFPTTFMIGKDGNVYGYVPGQMTEEIMRSIIEQTLNGS